MRRVGDLLNRHLAALKAANETKLPAAEAIDIIAEQYRELAQLAWQLEGQVAAAKAAGGE